MGTFVVLLVIAAVVGGVIWNHRNKAAAFAGVQFDLPEPPHAVVAAISATYCHGAKAIVKGAFSRIAVTPMGSGGFNFGTKLGDEGQIEVHPGQAGGSTVRASTSELYIGSNYRPSSAGMMALGAAISHLVCLTLRLAPYAANMKRFQHGLEQKIVRQAGRPERRA